MTESTTAVVKGEESISDRITGPHTEYDRYGRETGETYWTCENCGNQSLCRADLIDCFGCRNGVQF